MAPGALRAVVVLVVGALLAGCVGTASSPPGPAVSPSDTGPAASPASAIGQTNSPIARALATRLGADPFISHVEYVETITLTSGETASGPGVNRLSADLSGDTGSFHVTSRAGDGQTGSLDAVVAGTTTYIRVGDDPWRTMPTASVSSSMADFAGRIRQGATADNLTDLGVESIDGHQLHHLRAVTPPLLQLIEGGTGTYDRYDLWAEDDGTPIVIRTQITGATPAGATFQASEELRLSKFGQPVAISIPSIPPSDAPFAAWAGQRIRIAYPPTWAVRPQTDGAEVEFIAPETYPFLRVTNDGSLPKAMTLAALAKSDLLDIEENLGSKDARQSKTKLGGEDAVLTRFHNTGSTGTDYYTLKVISIHAGMWYEVVLYSKAGNEAESDGLMTRFLRSFAFQE